MYQLLEREKRLEIDYLIALQDEDIGWNGIGMFHEKIGLVKMLNVEFAAVIKLST